MKIMWPLIKKEILIAFKSPVNYLLTLLVPVLALLINVATMQTAQMNLNVDIYDPNAELLPFLSMYKTTNENMNIDLSYNNIPDKEFGVDNVLHGISSIFLIVEPNREIKIFYDESSQNSRIALQLLVVNIQNIISKDLEKTNKTLIEEVYANQKYIISTPINISDKSAESKNLNSLYLVALIWLFVFIPINQSINQIQSEKLTGTMLYLIKIPKPKIFILLSKQVSIIVQCFFGFSIVSLVNLGLHISDYSFQIFDFFIFVMIIMSISSIGHFLGLILKGTGISLIIVLIFTIPTMLTSSIDTSTVLDNYIIFIPTFYAGELIRDSVIGNELSHLYIIIISLIFIVFTLIGNLILARMDPLQLCEN
jgi:ABC-2 type transport system permease protein